MCDVLMPAVYKITVVQPHADPTGLGSISSAAFLEAYLGSLIVVLIALSIIIYQKISLKHGIRPQRRITNKGISIAALSFCLLFVAQGVAFGQTTELTVMGPPDNVLSGTMKDLSQSFSDANDIAMNITQVRGREAVLKEVMKDTCTADVVILEEEFPLFNLSGMKKLDEEKLIYNYTYLYSERALLVFRKDKPIITLSDLNGTIVAVTDQHVPGACLAKKIVEREGLNVTMVNTSSNEAQLDAVVAGSADATVLWKRMFESYENSTDPDIDTIDLPDYRMENYIAVLTRSKDPVMAQMYVDYLIKSLTREGIDDNEQMAATA